MQQLKIDELPEIVGHRGAAGLAPENTLAGFRLACELELPWVELDVHVSSDGALVVIHDKTVDRTTNGRGDVAAMSLAELQALDAGHGEPIPTLEEVLHVLRAGPSLLCELKAEGIEQQVVATLRNAAHLEHTIVTSFHLDWLKTVRSLDSALRTGAPFDFPSDEKLEAAMQSGVDLINIAYPRLCLALSERVKSRNTLLRAFNPDEERAQKLMASLGVDLLGTNRPDVALAWMG